MRVFMLGWEFPPFISGGLGTACYGLTKAMSQRKLPITFVLPKVVDSDYSSHVKLLSPQAPESAQGDRSPQSVASSYHLATPVKPGESAEVFSNVAFKAVPSRLSSPYPAGSGDVAARGETQPGRIGFLSPDSNVQPQTFTPQGPASPIAAATPSPAPQPATPASPDAGYHGDIMQEAQRYADLCVDLAQGQDIDVIHAHDWFTFPAGLAVARATGKPLVVHVHSTEYDRSGENIDSRVFDIERRGVHAATRVIAVSRRTRDVLIERYDMTKDRIDVVYNGVETSKADSDIKLPPNIKKTDKIVLFLGRVTMQKGPEYFIQAAKRVLQKMDGVKFVVAGTGDKIQEMIEMTARAGIGSKVVFTGFLRGADVERVFKMADVYVMPSVSEPFGIAPLEAISNDVPVIISKQSGVSEVLDHALKVDFWDTDEMANKILAVLNHPPLGATLREHAEIEVQKLTWDGAAERCEKVYEAAIAEMSC